MRLFLCLKAVSLSKLDFVCVQLQLQPDDAALLALEKTKTQACFGFISCTKGRAPLNQFEFLIFDFHFFLQSACIGVLSASRLPWLVPCPSALPIFGEREACRIQQHPICEERGMVKKRKYIKSGLFSKKNKGSPKHKSPSASSATVDSAHISEDDTNEAGNWSCKM